MKKNSRRLELNRETLLHLNPGQLRPAADGEGLAILQDTRATTCYSPWCAPTLQQGCQG